MVRNYLKSKCGVFNHIFDNECDGRSNRKSSRSDEGSNPVYLHPKKEVDISFALTAVTL